MSKKRKNSEKRINENLSNTDVKKLIELTEMVGGKLEVSGNEDQFEVVFVSRSMAKKKLQSIINRASDMFAERIEDYFETSKGVFHIIVNLPQNKPNERFEKKDSKIIEKVKGVQLKPNNEAEVVKFVGSGVYQTIDGEKRFTSLRAGLINVPMYWFITRTDDGRFQCLSPYDIEVQTTPAEYLSQKIGKDLDDRFCKLKKEFSELCEAFEKFKLYGGEKRKDLVDELADVNILIYHIANLLGFKQEQLKQIAMDKICRRMFEPNYKRKHNKKTK